MNVPKQSHGGVLWKKLFLKSSQNLQQNTCVRVSFIKKLQTWGMQFYQKRDTDTDDFLWILWNFFWLFFYGTPPRDCFGISMLMKKIQIEMLFSMQLFIMCYSQIDYRLLEYLNHPFSLSLLTSPNLNISFYVIFNLFCCDVTIKFTLRSKKLILEVRGQQYH